MKNILPILLGFALLPLAANGQTSYSNIVGYVSMNTPASGDTNVGQPLQRSASFAGAGTGISGNVITVANPGNFLQNLPTQPNQYYLRVTDSASALKGRYYDITGNDTTSITVDGGATTLQDQGFTATTKFSVVPYWTLNTLFPAGAGVGVSADPDEPVGLAMFIDPTTNDINKAATAVYFYYGGTGLDGAGWYVFGDTGAGKKDHAALEPFQCAIVRNLDGNAGTATVTGDVPAVPTEALVYSHTDLRDNYVCLQIPVDISLAESKLFENGTVVGTEDPDEVIDLVFTYDEELSQPNKPGDKAYFYYTGTGLNGAGWYIFGDTGAGLQSNVKLLKAGRQILIRKGAGSTGVGSHLTPLPYSVP